MVAENEQEIEVRAGAGEVWDDFVAYTVKNSWYGAENLSLIPGEVGASAVQNIGAYGVEAKDLIVSVETVEVETGRKRIFTKEECRYAYRESTMTRKPTISRALQYADFCTICSRLSFTRYPQEM